jgi:protein SCO1
MSSLKVPRGMGVSAEARKRTYATAILLAVLLLVATVSSVAALRQVFGSKPIVAPNFALIDQNAQPFTLSALRGHPVALFFGYTHCPDECPLTLSHLAKAVHAQGVPRDIRVVFITVDPVRDSPAVLKHYVRLFDPDFTGLTGSFTALNRVYADYHATHQDAPADHDRSEGLLEHGTTVYYVGRDGTIKCYGYWDDAVSEIAQNFRVFQ